MVVEPSPPDDLPVHARATIVVALHPVDAQVVATVLGMLRVHEGQRDERASVLGPRRDGRQLSEAGARIHHLGDRATRTLPGTHPQQGERHIPRTPELAEGRRDDGLRQVHEAREEVLGAPAEGQLHPARRAEQVRDDGDVTSDRIAEQERRAVRGDDPAVDLRHLQMRIHRSFHLHELILASQHLQELT